jgi:hypothetical protein
MPEPQPSTSGCLSHQLHPSLEIFTLIMLWKWYELT